MKYILYCRKSTDSEDRQVLSLDSQEHELISNIAEKHNLNIVKTFKESRTAKDAGRPLFGEMIAMIQSGKADAILCWKLDRLARNFLDGGLIMDMLQKGIIKEIRTYESIHLPNETAFIMAMQFGMANQYSRDLSVNVKRGNRARLEKGGWPNKAPFGYLNDKANKTVYIDPERGKFVARAFELYATGSHSLKVISNMLYEQGFRTVGGTKVHRSHIHRFISNPFYAGFMQRDGVLYAGNYNPLISKELFDQCQLVLQGKHHQKAKSLFFPLRGFLRCENCGCLLTASLKKGHQYYYCTNGKGICGEHRSYMRETYLYEKVAIIFDNLHFDEELIEIMYEAAKEGTKHKDDYVESVLASLQTRLDGLTAKESRLLDTFLAEQITKDMYDQKVRDIHNERVSLNQSIGETKRKGMRASITLEPTKEVFLRASRAKAEFLDASETRKREIVEKLLWNLTFKNGKVAKQQFKSPYDVLYRAPKKGDFLQLRRRWDSPAALGSLPARLGLGTASRPRLLARHPLRRSHHSVFTQ